MITNIKRRRVIVETPFAGNRERNAAYLKAAMKDCTDRGEAPFASHMLYTQFLDDDIPEERRAGMEAGFVWGDVAEACVVYGDFGVSDGMVEGMAQAMKRCQSIERRMLPDFKWGGCEGKEPNMSDTSGDVNGDVIRHDIGSVIRRLREGDCVWRKGWYDRRYLKLYVKGLLTPMTQEYIVICAENDDVLPWTASQADLLAQDWCVGMVSETS